MPRTYSVASAEMRSPARLYASKNFMPVPVIMLIRQTSPIIMGIRQASPMRQSKTKSSPTASIGVTIPPTASGMVWASSVSVSAALSSICLRSRPVRLALKYPSGRSMRWAAAAFRIFVATRKAARCVHMSPAK